MLFAVLVVVAPYEVSYGAGLRGFLHLPPTAGPHPAIVYNHGSEKIPGNGASVAAFFTARGYVLFFPHRRGHGVSAGDYYKDVAHGDPALVVKELEKQVDDVAEAIAFVRARRDVDRERVFVMGCSFGGIETVLTAERDVPVRAAVDFAGAAMSWQRSVPLQDRLKLAVSRAKIPIFFVQAENDYDTTPTRVLSKIHGEAKIYPPFGTTVEDGHGGFCHRGFTVWGEDVLKYLNR